MKNKFVSTILLSGMIWLSGIFLLSDVVAGGSADKERKIGIAEYIDKMEAGWIGQMVGVAWAAPTEFKFNDRIIPINEKTGLPERMQPLTKNTVNQAFGQDDLYVEMISRTVKIPKEKTTTLKLSVTGYQGLGQQWELLARVDMADVFQKVIKGSKKQHFPTPDLQEIDIDLTRYSGKEIMIDLYNRPAPGGNPLTALALWDQIDIVSE